MLCIRSNTTDGRYHSREGEMPHGYSSDGPVEAGGCGECSS